MAENEKKIFLCVDNFFRLLSPNISSSSLAEGRSNIFCPICIVSLHPESAGLQKLELLEPTMPRKTSDHVFPMSSSSAKRNSANMP